MDRGPEETLESIYELLSDCEHILEKECSDQRLSEMQEQLSVLTAQSEYYRRNLIDQQMNDSNTDLYRNRKAGHECGSSDADDRDGFLGKSGT